MPVAFFRRFLVHVLPHGFVRIRHYGLCASSNVNTKLLTARRLLEHDAESPTPEAEPTGSKPWWVRFREQTGVDVMACPSCEAGRMQRLRSLSAIEISAAVEHIMAAGLDTS